jgi:anti-sigma factor RsiW
MSEREPTRDELLAMAFADGELAGAERDAFEARLSSSPELRAQVTQYQRLAVLERAFCPSEPADHEWAALERELVRRAGRRIGFLLLGLGALAALVWMGWTAASSSLPTVAKLVLLFVLLGVTILFLVVLRARLRTLPYDPYRDVKR